MQLAWLQTFVQVSETRNFNRAAEVLEITQSTVSARIHALEDSLGTRLFERGRSGAQLTVEGQQLLGYCQNILSTWNIAERALSSSHLYRSNLRLSVQFAISDWVVNNWIAGVRQQFPKLQVHMEVDYSVSMNKGIQSGEVDIAVMYAPDYRPNVEVHHLFDNQFVMLSSEPMNIEDVTSENYIFVGLTDYFKERHRELLPHLQVSNLSMGLSMPSRAYLRDFGGAAYVSTRQAKVLLDEGKFHRVENAPIIEQPVFVVYLTRNKHNGVIAAAREILMSMAKAL